MYTQKKHLTDFYNMINAMNYWLNYTRKFIFTKKILSYSLCFTFLSGVFKCWVILHVFNCGSPHTAVNFSVNKKMVISFRRKHYFDDLSCMYRIAQIHQRLQQLQKVDCVPILRAEKCIESTPGVAERPFSLLGWPCNESLESSHSPHTEPSYIINVPTS